MLGLLGENGAGKTTLMNILSGLYRPDSGEILIDGTPRTFHDPAEAIEPGSGWSTNTSSSSRCSTSCRPSLSARKASRVRSARSTDGRAQAGRRALGAVQPARPARRRHRGPPVGVRQRVEILKALYRKSDILVLDEPSAVLTPAETEELFDIIRELAANGTTVIFITHKLNEVLEVCDRITVLRRGRVAGTAEPRTTTREQLANMMVGRDVELRVVKGPAAPGDVAQPQGRRRPRRP